MRVMPFVAPRLAHADSDGAERNRAFALSPLIRIPIGPIIKYMPLVRITTSASIAHDKKLDETLSKLSQLTATLFGKPERWVMTCLDPAAKMTFSGTTEACCYVEVKNIGTMTGELTEQLSQELCQFIGREFNVPNSRIYIEFSEAKGHLWGWDGSTFA